MNAYTFRAEVADAKQLSQALSHSELQYIYAPEQFLTADLPCKERIIAVPPVFLADCGEYLSKRLAQLSQMGYGKVLAHTVDHILPARESGMTLYGGARLNITNSASAAFFAQQGFEDIVLSVELTRNKLNSVKSPIPKGIVAYGRLPLMTTRRCPVNDGKPCGGREQCDKMITDRQGRQLKTLCRNTVELLNPDVLYIGDKLSDFSADFFLLKFTDENDISQIISRYKNGEKPTGKFTRGLYYRGVE